MGEIKQLDNTKTEVMGIDLGINIPAYCSLTNNSHIRKAFGSRDEFLKVREQFKNRRKRLQQQVTLAKGGKGRRFKIKSLYSGIKANSSLLN